MIYTIAQLEEAQGSLILNIDKNGNMYTVGLYNKETKEYTSQTFNSIAEAYKVFEKLSSWIIFSYYTEKAKRQFLATGTMD